MRGIDAGRAQVLGHDGVEGFGQHGLLLVVQRELAVLGHIPVREQLQLAAQHSFVIGWQHTGLGGQLPAQQQLHRLAIPGLSVAWLLGVEDFNQRAAAHVGQQHEAIGCIPGQDLRHRQGGLCHQLLHMHKRLAVFLVRRRIHDDEAVARAGINAQIAAKACIGGCRA